MQIFSNMNWNAIIIALVGAAGFWAVVKAIVDKQKTAYDMLISMIEEEKEFYKMRNTEFEKEKLSSAEKSAVIAKSNKCLHRFKDPSIECPVDKANDERLENHCKKCEYNPEVDDKK